MTAVKKIYVSMADLGRAIAPLLETTRNTKDSMYM